MIRFERYAPDSRRTARAMRRLTVLLLLIGLAGCSRAFYRRQADQEAYCLVDHASRRTESPLVDYTIQPNVESRYFDPACPDCPPMPPDDPASHQLMRCVDGKEGWCCWDIYGHTPCVESPDWKCYLPLNEEGQLAIDRTEAIHLALLHSPDYQNELEDLYLSALSVSFERFRLDAQFFGGNSTFFTADGPDRTGVASSELRTDTDLQMTKLFATGAELVVGMANSLVWQFAGPDEYTATTLLDFSLIQPLLRAGGRPVVLELLTEAERGLLANIRQMERFRRGFYVNIVTGRSSGPGPTAGRLTLGSLFPGAPGAVGGFLGLLETQIRLRNQEANVAGLRDSYEQLRARLGKPDASAQERFQVDLSRQALYDAQSRLLALEASYQERLDNYKTTLGLPPDLEMAIDDPLLAQFDLIDPKLTAIRTSLDKLLRTVREDEPDSLDEAMQEYLAEATRIREGCLAHLEVVQDDLDRLDEALPDRRKSLEQLAQREEVLEGDIDRAPFDVEVLDQNVIELKRDFNEVTADLEATLGALKLLAEQFEQAQAQAALPALRGQLIDRLSNLTADLTELLLVQAEARVQSITLVPIELDSETAFKIACRRRRDWKNARAALVDVWRKIEVVANDLESDLDIVFSGDISTKDNNPVRFRGTTGRLRVGLEFDAPLTRLAERNAYRETLIEYQRARRTYYSFEDTINQSLRDTIRIIRLNQLDFEIAREAVRLAINQVELTQVQLERPPRPGETSQFGATTARDLVQALSGLLNSQNDFLAIWVNYEVQRLNLDLDLGTMELDAEGNWIDPGPIGPEGPDGAGDADAEQPCDLVFPELILPEVIPTPEGDPGTGLQNPESPATIVD